MRCAPAYAIIAVLCCLIVSAARPARLRTLRTGVAAGSRVTSPSARLPQRALAPGPGTRPHGPAVLIGPSDNSAGNSFPAVVSRTIVRVS